MKTVEIINGKERRITPFTPLMRRVGGIVTNLQMRRDEQLLTPEAKERLKAYGEELHRIGEQAIARVRSDRIKFQPEVIEGKTYYTLGEAGIAYFALRRRLEREAAARGDTQIDESQLPWQLHPLPEPEPPSTEEERLQRDIPIVRKLHTQLVQEVEDAQFDQMAGYIKTRMWKDRDPLTQVSSLQRSGDVHVTIKDDETVINRSRFGVSLSYTQDDDTEKPVRTGKNQEPNNEIVFGIGYFGNRGEVIAQARESVSDEELEKGVKAYFIQRKKEGKTEMYVVPLAYAEAQKEFIEYLYEIAELHSPKYVRSEARRRRQRTYQAAA